LIGLVVGFTATIRDDDAGVYIQDRAVKEGKTTDAVVQDLVDVEYGRQLAIELDILIMTKCRGDIFALQSCVTAIEAIR